MRGPAAAMRFTSRCIPARSRAIDVESSFGEYEIVSSMAGNLLSWGGQSQASGGRHASALPLVNRSFGMDRTRSVRRPKVPVDMTLDDVSLLAVQFGWAPWPDLGGEADLSP